MTEVKLLNWCKFKSLSDYSWKEDVIFQEKTLWTLNGERTNNNAPDHVSAAFITKL